MLGGDILDRRRTVTVWEAMARGAGITVQALLIFPCLMALGMLWLLPLALVAFLTGAVYVFIIIGGGPVAVLLGAVGGALLWLFRGDAKRQPLPASGSATRITIVKRSGRLL